MQLFTEVLNLVQQKLSKYLLTLQSRSIFNLNTFDKHIKGEISIYTRDLFLYEFTSAFKNYFSQKIEEKDFSLAISALMSLKIKFQLLKFQETEELFLLLAEKLKAPFYTADKELYLKGKNFTETVLV